MTHPEMSAPTLALYLRRIQHTRSVSALNTLADEIERATLRQTIRESFPLGG